MFRALLCATVAVFLCGDLALAKGKGNKSPITIGTIKSVDPGSGSVIVTVKSKKGDKDKSFTISDDTPISITTADGSTKDLKGKSGLKSDVVKEGASIQVTSDASGTVTAVAIGGVYKKPHKKKAA